MQKYWDDSHVFEVDASDDLSEEKFMVSFPYPYMNGRLHLGHSFSMSKCEFAAGFERLQGKKVLFPFGFHCTGMPIKACADKLKKEMEKFGNPPVFPVETAENDEPEKAEPETKQPGAPAAMKKKGKVAAKSSGAKYQWQIMQSLGIPDEEIPKFADATYWLQYFPPLAIDDLKKFGVHVDWRRSFITTDVNPYYDSFVRWQFNKLKALDKIKFGKRYTIYSPMDDQPCMDHDRQTGEGVLPQEYTIIKLQVVEPLPDTLKQLQGKNVILPAATLRPETMYGQTNCYVGPDLDYGAFQINDSEVFICTERSALNLAFQGYSPVPKKVSKLLDLKGSDLVGLKVKAPLAKYDGVYVLPMESVLETKGTGIVTSVPSDSPDDFATLSDLKKKFAYYKIKEEWVKPFDPSPIIRTPGFGDLAAVTACQELKINSPKDRKQLDIAKEKVYKEGFYGGIMLVGDYKGKPVSEAKPLIRQMLIEKKLAIPYYEPESLVMSRSGDECVVCLADQWYLNYGEESWKKLTHSCLEKLNCYHDDTKKMFQATLEWLREWACSRSYGLGSRLPWDETWLIESLSDSTIYMAYYTISHLLQSNSLDGSKGGILNIKPEEMTEHVWEYVFCDGAYPTSSKISKEKLERLKKEFSYFYPLDLRVSGKDLVTNHLTFFLYNHTAIFKEKHWPQAVRANGHLMINNKKMSKSTGNFLTLYEAIEKFGADATRCSLAEAGDAVEDANFSLDKANATILKMYNWKEWAEETMKENESGKLRNGTERSFNDLVFENELKKLMKSARKSYSTMLYYDAVKYALHESFNARDRYVKYASLVGEKMNMDVLQKYMEWQAISLAPIMPHFSEYIWLDLLKKPSSIMQARWPAEETVNEQILLENDYLEGTARDVRLAIMSETQPKKKKGKPSGEPLPPPTTGVLFVADDYPDWQKEVTTGIRSLYDKAPGNTMDMKDLLKELNAIVKKETLARNKKFQSFVKEMKDLADAKGLNALDRRLPFNETEVLNRNIGFLKVSLGLNDLQIKSTKDATEHEQTAAQSAVPGAPSCYFPGKSETE